jgi:hypothetical protein
MILNKKHKTNMKDFIYGKKTLACRQRIEKDEYIFTYSTKYNLIEEKTICGEHTHFDTNGNCYIKEVRGVSGSILRKVHARFDIDYMQPLTIII